MSNALFNMPLCIHSYAMTLFFLFPVYLTPLIEYMAMPMCD